MNDRQRVNQNLIFDIGLHKGNDAQFYVRKGFSVVGVEARADHCTLVGNTFKDSVDLGRLVIVNKALFSASGSRVSFFVNPIKDDWGSLSKGSAEKGVATAFEIEVETTTLNDLIDEYGYPYYIKCDIEGADSIFVQQLVAQPYRPPFISIEVNGVEDVARLFSAGYDSFQIINQQFNWVTRPPNPSREGNYAEQVFDGEMSGLFGRELPPDGWSDFSTAIGQILDWLDLASRNKRLAEGWLDVHCSTKDVLLG